MLEKDLNILESNHINIIGIDDHTHLFDNFEVVVSSIKNTYEVTQLYLTIITPFS